MDENEDKRRSILDLVKEKRTLLNNLRSRRWNMIGHTDTATAVGAR
jgi:hypothetical protein